MTIQRQKEILIAVFVCLYSLLFFMGVILFSTLPERTPFSTTLVVIGALVWTALMVTATSFVVNRSGWNMLMTSIPPLLVIVLGKFTLDSIVGAAIVFILLWALQRKVSTEINNHVKLKITSVLYESTRLALFTLLVTVITLSLPSIIRGFKNDSEIVPTKYVAAVSKPLEPLFSRWIPGYKTDSTIDQIIDNQIIQQGGGFIPLDNPIVVDQKNQAKSDLGKRLGVSLTGRETAVTIASRLINNYIFNLTKGNHYIGVAIVIVVTFLAMKAIVPILVWPVLVIIKTFFYLSSRIGLITFMKSTVEVDRFTL